MYTRLRAVDERMTRVIYYHAVRRRSALTKLAARLFFRSFQNWAMNANFSDQDYRVMAPQRYDTPEKLSGRVEETLNAVTEAAAEELSAWADELSDSELRSLRDPRNWVRPAAAIAAGGVAAGGLVVLELRRHRKRRPSGISGIADQVDVPSPTGRRAARALLGAPARARLRDHVPGDRRASGQHHRLHPRGRHRPGPDALRPPRHDVHGRSREDIP